MSNNYNRDYCEELLLNSGGSVTKTIHSIDVDATPEQIKDIVLCSHSNLKTPSQRLQAFNSIQQRPDEPCKHTIVNMSPTLSWPTQVLLLKTLDPEHNVSTMPIHYTAS